MMASIFRSIVCLFSGHFYRPCYEHKYSQHEFSPRGRMTNQRFRYECACCHKPTKWMSASQHAEFLIKHNPTWGER